MIVEAGSIVEGIVKPTKRKNLLHGTRCYMIGAMEFQNGEGWRNDVKKRLSGRGIQFFDPYHKPFTHDVPEDEESRRQMSKWREEGQYDLLESRMNHVVADDLWLCYACDWFIAHINPTVPSWGSADELYTVIEIGKPVFISIDHPKGKKATPYWWFGKIPHKYIYDTLPEIMDIVEHLDEGVIPMHSNKWKLLKPSLR
jgi:hypothetical protein